MSRIEALKLLENKPYDENEKQYFLEYVLKKLDFTTEEFESIVSAKNKVSQIILQITDLSIS